MFIGLDNTHSFGVVQPSDVESKSDSYRTLTACWQVDGVNSESSAIGAILSLAAEQYIPSTVTITRLIPRPPTEDERIEAARRILRADYWSDVRNVADNLRDEIRSGNITDADAATEWLDETVDGCQRVIYTAQAIEGLLYSDNEGAYESEMGSAPEPESFADGSAWSQLMYHAFRADITAQLGDLDELIESLAPKVCEARGCDNVLADDADSDYCAECEPSPTCDDCGDDIPEQDHEAHITETESVCGGCRQPAEDSDPA